MGEQAIVEPRRGRGLLFELAETLVLTVVIFLGVQAFVAQPYQVEQHSMERTLQPGQYLLVDKLTPRWAPYARGDIVVFEPPAGWDSGLGAPFIKRVIGLPGDHVELRDGSVFVNGAKLDEPYLFRENGAPQSTDSQDGTTSWVVPDGDLLLFGDHRSDSSDSRSFGPVDSSRVIGRAWLRYWPLEQLGILGHPEATAAP